MRIFDTEQGFGAITKLLHWLTFGLVAALFGIGWIMTELPNTPGKFQVYHLHKSIGLGVLVLSLLRLGWRSFNSTLDVLGGPQAWQRIVARSTHGLIYIALFMLPLSGWLLSSASDFPIVWFGWLEIPYLVEPEEGLRKLTGIIHSVLGLLMLSLIVIHVGASIYHHWFVGDRTFLRMLPRFLDQGKIK